MASPGKPTFLKRLSQVEVDPAAEETKGGAGHVAKALFSYGPDRVGVVCYVPKKLQVCWGQLGLERGLGAGNLHEFPTQGLPRSLVPTDGLFRTPHTSIEYI